MCQYADLSTIEAHAHGGFMNFADGGVGSISLVLLHHFELLHHGFVSSIINSSMSCLVAERLVGRASRGSGGRKFGWLELRTAASLASLSTALLPTGPMSAQPLISHELSYVP